jgi:hypothetical protein
VENAHWRYANSSYGHNAYITAIDVNKQDILWRSEPLVANAVNFEVLDQVIVCSYGFLREGAWVYALDKLSGQKVGEIKLTTDDEKLTKKHPEYIFCKGQNVFLKTFDGSEYVLRMQ